MKIVIIEDDVNALQTLTRVLEGVGHEVLGLQIVDSTFPLSLRYEDTTYCVTLQEIAVAVRAFQPDKILLDHELGRNFSGNDVAGLLGIPPKMIIGTSTHFDQKYAGKVFRSKSDAERQLDRILETLV